MLLEASHSLLLVVDIQGKLAPAIDGAAVAIRNNQRLLAAADRLAVPVFVSEQYVQGLGSTVADLLPLPAAAQVFEKNSFSCTREAGVLDRLRACGRQQLVVTGMETHVCVLQSVLGLLEAGFDVFVVADATSSRTPDNRAAGIARMAAAGANVVSTEMVIFEWLQRAATDDFRALLPLIK